MNSILDSIPAKPLRKTRNPDLPVTPQTDQHLFQDFPSDLYNDGVVMKQLVDNINSNNTNIEKVMHPDYVANLVKEYQNSKQIPIQKLTEAYSLIAPKMLYFFENHGKYGNIMKINIQGRKGTKGDVKAWADSNQYEYMIVEHFIRDLQNKGWKPFVETNGRYCYDSDGPGDWWEGGEMLTLRCDFN